MNNKNKNNRLGLSFRNNKVRLFPKHKLDIFNHIVSGLPIQAEATALFDQWTALGTPASSARKTIVNATIYYLKQANMWDELDVLYMWASHSQTAALVDWKNPTTRTATVVNDYVGAFVVDNYFKGNGTNFRINTNYNPGDGGTYNLTQNSAFIGIYMPYHVNEGRTELSGLETSTSGLELNALVTSFSTNIRMNNVTARASSSNYTNRGGMYGKRTASNLFYSSRGGYDMYGILPKSTDASNAVANASLNCFCRNTNGAYSSFSTKPHSFMVAGSSNINEFEFNRIIEKYYLDELNLIPRKRVILLGNSFIARGILTQNLTSTIGYDDYEIYSIGLNGKDLSELNTYFLSDIYNKTKDYLTNDVFVIQELTNDFYNTSSNISTTYGRLTILCSNVRTYLPDSKIIVPSMLPRQENVNMVNARRQNDGNLLDNATLNGKIRNELVQNGYADNVSDYGSDSLMGIYSGGVAGVGEKNLIYYDADEIHPNNGTGFPRLGTNFLTPSIQAYL